MFETENGGSALFAGKLKLANRAPVSTPDTEAIGVSASWLIFRVVRSTVMIQIAALRSRLEKKPSDLRRSPRH
jgi:hypothetical protein